MADRLTLHEILRREDEPLDGPAIEPAFCSAWIQRDGTFRYVPRCNHFAVALHITASKYDASDDLESQGWLHFSVVEDRVDVTVNLYCNKSLSQAQLDTLFDILMVTPERYRATLVNAIRRLVPEFMMDMQ